MLRKLGLGLLFCLSLTMGFAAVAQDANKYAEIDKHALSTPPSKERDMRNLVRYLIKPAKTDEMKARAIFRWITDRLAYDFKGVEDKDGIKKAEDAFNERKANCEGYSRLFAEMADIAGLDAKVVLGKTSDYFDASRRERVGHAWNVV